LTLSLSIAWIAVPSFSLNGRLSISNSKFKTFEEDWIVQDVLAKSGSFGIEPTLLSFVSKSWPFTSIVGIVFSLDSVFDSMDNEESSGKTIPTMEVNGHDFDTKDNNVGSIPKDPDFAKTS
jgi:hypothetical protein